MFSSSPLEKNCIGPENCSSGRHNSSNRFPVGITSLGDENQQSRIQLAVHKYNSSTNSLLSSRCAVISPVRQNYLKTSLKAKNYEGDTDGSSVKNEKKSGNQYEGVGAFPTIHLKKSAVRYRPIKKFNDVKIPYPELPVNRFLSHLPEVCSDLKSSTRSVLDVLEDLSGKKIHSKQDSTTSKPVTKGLGGDNLLNPTAVYKPLFVQKSKVNSVLTRDNTTQTLYPLGTEIPGPQISNMCNKNDDSDPKAELRRKLAKQNNEIFASLSSSISSSFALKRKIDKVLPVRDDEQLTDGSATKKSKMSDHEVNNYSENGISKPTRSKTNLTDSTKSSRKGKFNDTSTPTSPNKDRLTTIFLDMQNTSPKSQIFETQSASKEKCADNSAQASSTLSNGFLQTSDNSGNKLSTPRLNGSMGASSAENDKGESENPSRIGLVEKTSSPDSVKPDSEQTSKPTFSFPLCKGDSIPNDVTELTSPAFQFGVSTSNDSNFSLGKASVSESPNSSETSHGTKSESVEKKDNNNQALNAFFTFGKSSEKPAFGSFKFGADENASSPALNTSPKDTKAETSSVAPVVATTSSATVTQFSFGDTTATAEKTTQQSRSGSAIQNPGVQFGVTSTAQQPSSVSAIQTPAVQFGVTTTASQFANASTTQTPVVQFGATSAQAALSVSSKPTFTFGQIAFPGQAEKSAEKVTLPNGLQASAAPTAQSIQPIAFTFGQKSNLDSPAKTASGQNVENRTVGTSQSNTLSFSSGVTSLGTNSTVSTQSNKSLFTFGQKAESPVNSSPPVSAAQEQKISFSFGQKSDADQNKPQEGSSQKSATLFSFGQKSTAQDSTTTTMTPTATSTGQPASTQPTSMFGQNASQSAAAFQVKFGKTSTAEVPSSTGTKSEAGFLGNTSAPAFSQSNTAFSIKTPLFGSSTTGFGCPSTQTSVGFGTSTTSASGLSFGSPATTQSTPAFSTSSAPQTTLTFGVSTPQSVSGFGSAPALQSTSAFSVAGTTQSTSTFGVSSTTQSAPPFGVSSPQTSGAFGNPATSVSRFPVQAGTGFGTPAVTSSSGFGTSQPSFSLALCNKPAGGFGQSPGSSFSSSPAFSSNQNNIFGQKPNGEGDVFDQSKIQAPSFNTQNKFSFGMSTSNATGFTTSPPKTTAAPVFSFGGGSQNTTNGTTFSFGSNSSASNSTQLPFGFKGPTNEPFKFGATSAKEESAPGFGGTGSGTFTFGGQMADQKPTFSFGNTQVSSSAPFTFGTTPSPSVFSFGGSTSGSSGSSFNFGTPTPSPFGLTSNASPGKPFAVPGTFSIGSGTSQARPRATSRPRRRP